MSQKNRIKRFVDLALALPLIVLFSPLMAAIALIVRFTIGKKVFFQQYRPGIHGKKFILYKFTTMTDKRDDKNKLLPDSERLTRIGRMLRSFSLDEIPELWNVIKGDMSLVGPRPLLMEYLPLYNSHQARRHDVKPGLTGWAQVKGRNALTWEERFELDIWYIENASFVLDLKILFMTIWTVLNRKGISHEGSVTMEKFKGIV